MKHVVSYDVSDDAIRLRVAHALQKFGQRVQKSVFECQLQDGQLDECIAILKRVLEDPENGNIRIYKLCENCEGASVGMGNLKVTLDSEPCAIV